MAWVKVMALLPDTVKSEVPVTDKAPVCVIAPLDKTVKLPPRVEAARIVSVLSVNCTAPVPDDKVTVLVKSLEVFVRVIALVFETVKLEVPVTANAIFCVISPVVAVRFRIPPTAPSVLASMNRSPSPVADASRDISALSTNVIFPNVSFPAVSAKSDT